MHTYWQDLAAGGGVWGRSPTADCSQAPSVSDEDLQAQAWFPATLTSMLHLSELAASITLDTCEHTLHPLAHLICIMVHSATQQALLWRAKTCLAHN